MCELLCGQNAARIIRRDYRDAGRPVTPDYKSPKEVARLTAVAREVAPSFM
jgi:hypothetical protein